VKNDTAAKGVKQRITINSRGQLQHREPPTRMIPPATPDITGVVLAGGAGRRLGGLDKGLLLFRGRPLVEWVIEALRPQVGALIISANRNLERYAAYGLPVVTDHEPGFQGPLAGIHGAMRTARTQWIITLPCDGPYPAPDLAARLALALAGQDADLAVASDGRRIQTVHALLPIRLAADLADFLAGGERQVSRWYARHRMAVADLSNQADTFRNINTSDEALALGGH
jgi:molybdenum cofactor guanylyltransferase